jgi:hypothetical protein
MVAERIQSADLLKYKPIGRDRRGLLLGRNRTNNPGQQEPLLQSPIAVEEQRMRTLSVSQTYPARVKTPMRQAANLYQTASSKRLDPPRRKRNRG